MKHLANFCAFLLLLAIAFPAQAERISTDDARRVAENFARERGLHAPEQYRATHVQTRRVSSSTLRASTDEPVYYVFSQPAGEGFIIVAADDAAKPVLGYSTESDYDENNLNFRYWMDGLANEIAEAIEQKLEGDETTKREWTELKEGTGRRLRASTASVPNLLSTTWNQTSPYNNSCPSGTVTGCVATAMAQIMKYFNYPTQGTGSHTSEGSPQNTVNFASTTYQWNNMLNSYSGSYSNDQATAVATLMYHCGISVDMNYGTTSSATTRKVGSSLITYFKYDKGIKYTKRAYYSVSEWEALLKSELNESRPILFGGQDDTENNKGHAFICSGYDESQGKYYFNWGWGSYCDGYYVISALNPGTGGTGSGNGRYNRDQEIVYNFKTDPAGTSQPTYSMVLWAGSSIVASKTTVDRDETFTVNVPVINRGYFEFSGNIGIAIFDGNGQISTVIGQSNLSLQPNYGYDGGQYNYYVPVRIPTTTAPGTYTIKAVYKTDNDDWAVLKGTTDATDALTITVTDTPVPTHQLKITADLTSTASDISINSPFTVSTAVFNKGTSTFNGAIAVVICDNSDNILGVLKNYTTSTSLGYNYGYSSINVECTIPSSFATGTYRIRLAAKPADNDWSLIYGSSVSIVDYVSISLTNTTPPAIVSFTPVNNATNVPVAGSVQIVFNRAMDTNPLYGDITIGTMPCRNKTWSENNTVCTISYVGLTHSTTYTMLISGFKDVSGNQMNEYTPKFTTIAAPASSSWQPQNNSTDWFSTSNWTNGIPGSTTDVYINQSSSYPILTKQVSVASITLEPGAELGRQDLLSGGTIRVAYDFSAANSRNRTYLLASPIQGVYAGDFTFGGYPSSFLYEYAAATNSWVQINDLGKELTPGTGFALYLKGGEGEDVDGKGLNLTNGIVRQPYFDIADAAAHPAHTYADGTSTFYRYKEDKTVNFGSIAATASRTYSGKPQSYSYQMGAPVSFGTEGFALVGNPMISTLDFGQFYYYNSAIIKNTFHLWTGNSYACYNQEGWSGDISVASQGAFIAPLQGFFVESAENPGNSLLFRVDYMSKATNPVPLRASTNDAKIADKLDITATAGNVSILTFIARRDSGSDLFSDADSRKLLDGVSAAPEVYTLKNDLRGRAVPTGANIVRGGDITVPVGIATEFEGEITLTFAGMDSYSATITLLDAATGERINLTGLSSYEHRFAYAPRKVNGETVATNDRFSLQISHSPLAINRLADADVRFAVNGRNLNVATSDGSQLRTVEIWSVQGQLIAVCRNIDAATLSVNLPGIAPEAVIVRATTDRGVRSEKLTVKSGK